MRRVSQVTRNIMGSKCDISFTLTAGLRSYRGLVRLLRVGLGPLGMMWLAAFCGSIALPRVRAQVPAPARVWMPFSHFGTGVTISTTGVGVEAAVPYGAYWNIRAGVSYFAYSRTFQSNGSSTGLPYEGHLRLGGARLGVDWFPLAGRFHVI